LQQLDHVRLAGIVEPLHPGHVLLDRLHDRLNSRRKSPRAAQRVGRTVEQSGGQNVNARASAGNPHLVVRGDSAATVRVGLNRADVENQLSAALYGQVVGTLPEQDHIMNIRVAC
jgi:Cu/Ag efflux pump CusA